MEIKDWLTFTLGATGTLLGLVNLIRDIKKNRAKLTATAYPAFHTEFNGVPTQFVTTSKNAFTESLQQKKFPNGVTVEVINIGLTATYIVGCGLTYQDSKQGKGRYYFTIGNDESKKFPMKLEPSAQYGIGVSLSAELLKYLEKGMDCAFVELTGGRVIKGNSAVFHAYREHLGLHATHRSA